MTRLLASLFGVGLVLLSGCGSGGAGGGSSPQGPSAVAIDADPKATPVTSASVPIPTDVLGAVVSGGNVTFSYWNPNASSVSVCLYGAWNDALSAPAAPPTPMVRNANGGIWTVTLPTPSQNFYVYQVGGSYVLDPYSKSMAQWVHINNGASIPGDSTGKGAIVDPAVSTPDGGAWTHYGTTSDFYFDGSGMKGIDGTTVAQYTYTSNRDAIVYEAGIRDLTVDPLLSGFTSGHKWGTYKGLVDLLPHIQKLGVTHVQLLCPLENYNYDQTKNGTREIGTIPGTSADFLSLTKGANYNWGYDPQSYFTPSGMYSATPTNPVVRIQELKTLINEIHKQGMGVILDVVYNHSGNGNNVLGDPGIQGYYYRTSAKNGAGSNDVQSEAKMVRKLIVDSITYFVTEYKADGFRFDLMGVIDSQTIKDAYDRASAINSKVLFLGEGWNGFYTGPGMDYNAKNITGSDQNNASQFNTRNIALFSDSYRDLIKSGGFSDGLPAFISGGAKSTVDLFSNIAGLPTNFTPGSTNNVASYLTAHDNLCLYDVLAKATHSANNPTADGILLKRGRMGYAVLLTSQGMAFIHAGDEMFRTKESSGATANTVTDPVTNRYFVHDSYNSSDAINLVKWANVYTGGNPLAGNFANYDTAKNGYQLYAYTRGLIALRKSTNAFRLPDPSRAANLTSIPVTGVGATTLAFGYKAASTDSTGTYYVFHNADSTAKTFTVSADLSTGTLLADGATAGLTAIVAPTGVTATATTVTLQPLTSAIFKK